MSVSIGASNLNVLPKAAATNSAEDYIEFFDAGEFDVEAGIEWSGLRFPAARRAGRALAEAGYISVVHESWNEDTPLSAISSGLEGLQIAVAFPRLDKSYKQLDKIQAKAGKKLPIIIHPDGQYLGEKPPKRPREKVPEDMFSEIWYQPTAEWAAWYGIETDTDDTASIVEQIALFQSACNLDRTAVDLHHLTAERNGQRFKNPGAVAVALVQAPTFGELQMSIRPDFGGERSSLIAACEGRLLDTEMGEILAEVASAVDTDREIRVVSEIAATEIVAAGQEDIPTAHAAINAGIRELFS